MTTKTVDIIGLGVFFGLLAWMLLDDFNWMVALFLAAAVGAALNKVMRESIYRRAKDKMADAINAGQWPATDTGPSRPPSPPQ